jgi:dinuclear metal center YbgI/SA1388 family protein
MTKLKKIIKYLEAKAPMQLAESWDNVGLQVGDDNQEVSKGLVALTVTDAVVQNAIDLSVDIIISHHPLIFDSLKAIQTSDPIGRKLEKLIKNNIALYVMHTNLDVIADGVSFQLAKATGLKNGKLLREVSAEELYKLVVFVPKDNLEEFSNKVFEAGAGYIGNYSNCGFSQPGIGTFLPQEGTNPYIGEQGKLEKVEEFRWESIVPKSKLSQVINSISKNHPYEEPAFDIYPLKNKGRRFGYGYIGKIENATIDQLQSKWGGELKGYGKDTARQIGKVAVCGGSGAFLLKNAAQEKVDVYITGDIKYHDHLLAEDLGLTILDIGHYASELPIVNALQEWLSAEFQDCVIESYLL